MSSLLKPSLPDAFRLTLWAKATDEGAKARRARWTASLAVLGIRTFERHSRGSVALFREGAEAVDPATVRKRKERDKY